MNDYFWELIKKLNEQIYLIAFSSVIAILFGILIGIFVFWHKKLENFALSFTSVLWTIPSLALFGLLLPIFGLGKTPALIVLTLYTLLPIIQNTVTGLSEVNPQLIEAAHGLGMTKLQRLRLVELPLAFPVIRAGIHTGVIFNISMSTLAAFVGAGGLGDFINRGLATNNMNLLLLGAIPIAVLALVINFLFSQKTKYHLVWLSLFALLLLMSIGLEIRKNVTTSFKVTVASKNFTEQIILAELIAQRIEAKTSLKVDRKFNLGSASIIHEAMLRGEVDIYPEYTGTAYLTMLHLPYKKIEKNDLYKVVKKKYQTKFHITWLDPFGFNSTQTVAVKEVFSKKYQIQTLTDLIPFAPTLTIGAPPEFLVLPDAMPGLKSFYGLNFKKIKTLSAGLLYESILENAVDVIFAFTTDARVPYYHLHFIEDDKQFFLPYYAAPIIREDILKKHPEIQAALQPLLGSVNETTMRYLNGEVDIKKKSPESVAREFLKNI